MPDIPILRVARPTDNLAAIRRMYVEGLGFELLGECAGHAAFDGVILGHPNWPYQLEFTAKAGHTAGTAPSQDHLLVFFWRSASEPTQIRYRASGSANTYSAWPRFGG